MKPRSKEIITGHLIKDVMESLVYDDNSFTSSVVMFNHRHLTLYEKLTKEGHKGKTLDKMFTMITGQKAERYIIVTDDNGEWLADISNRKIRNVMKKYESK